MKRFAWIGLVALALVGGMFFYPQPAPSRPRHLPAPPGGAKVYGYRVVKEYPHDPDAFTQGLLFHQGHLYESVGRRGHSELRQVELETGQVLKRQSLEDAYFAEGLALHGEQFFQLTWQAGQAFIYNRELEPVKKLLYTTEGWGLTNLGDNLVMSNGSSELTVYQPQNFLIVRKISVHHQGQPIDRLNELEWVEGEIWANRWFDGYLVRISPETGEVLSFVDLRSLFDYTAHPKADVVNGIAYDADTERLFVTGKFWPSLFQIELLDPGRQ